ncbi:hypothetical protein [Shewanella putrefaciens]|uniref:hypothetical protein n=1 Tax=Shewanella putrefaciens TaxID=24 RepID=UPI003D79CFE1
MRSHLRRDLVIDTPLWSMSRPTTYRLVKQVMDSAGIVGQQAIGKGLQNGFGVAMVTANSSVPLHVISQLMGTVTVKRRKFICRFSVKNAIA